MGIYQGLVDEHGFAHSYESVKRYVRALRGGRTLEAHPIITSAPGEEGQVDHGGDGPMVRDPKSKGLATTIRTTLVRLAKEGRAKKDKQRGYRAA